MKLKVLPQILEGIVSDPEKTVKDIIDLAFSALASQKLKKQALNETMKCRTEVTLQDFRACDGFNIMGSISSITTPALIICGADDTLTPPKYSLYLKNGIKDSQLITVEDAGHMVMLEKPEEVNRAIEQFIKNEKDRL